MRTSHSEEGIWLFTHSTNLNVNAIQKSLVDTAQNKMLLLKLYLVSK